ncbi:hypothetical protein [Paenibacillus humicola]|uniref:hypothetical protein n=1 Tax=Paenibacillus humicola TaxID=3110540 RepID=UPI00237AB0A5|nr:hypothetical protein [Paenibacillus humicola]
MEGRNGASGTLLPRHSGRGRKEERPDAQQASRTAEEEKPGMFMNGKVFFIGAK